MWVLGDGSVTGSVCHRTSLASPTPQTRTTGRCCSSASPPSGSPRSPRQSGHASEAVSELWPLVARLEARIEDGHTEREVLHLLARARVGLGIALGNVLPEERLSTAARWTAKSLDITEYFEDPGMTSYVLRMHGDELRKARLPGAAVERLCRAAALAPDDDARAAGALGNGELFDQVMRETDDLLSRVGHVPCGGVAGCGASQEKAGCRPRHRVR
jgi:hypothetical protein